MKELADVIHDRLVLKKDYENTFNTPSGKRVLVHLMKISGIPKKSVCMDTNQLLIQEGSQFLIYTIFRILNTDPEQLMTTITEHYEDE